MNKAHVERRNHCSAAAVPATGQHTAALSCHDLRMQAAERRVGRRVEGRDGGKKAARRCCAPGALLRIAAAYQLLQKVAPPDVPARRPVCRWFWNAHCRRGHGAGEKVWVWLLKLLVALLLLLRLLRLEWLLELVWVLLLLRDWKATASAEGCCCLCILCRALYGHAGCSLGVEDGCGCRKCVQRSREGRPGGGSGSWDRKQKMAREKNMTISKPWRGVRLVGASLTSCQCRNTCLANSKFEP